MQCHNHQTYFICNLNWVFINFFSLSAFSTRPVLAWSVNLSSGGALQLLHQPVHINRRWLLPRNPALHFIDKRGQIHQHSLLLGMAFFKTHFLDADLAVGEFVLAQDDGEGDTALLGGAELLREFGFEFVRKFSLWVLVVDCCTA